MDDPYSSIQHILTKICNNKNMEVFDNDQFQRNCFDLPQDKKY